MEDKNLDDVDAALADYISAAAGLAVAAANKRPQHELDYHAGETQKGRVAYKAALKRYVEASAGGIQIE